MYSQIFSRTRPLVVRKFHDSSAVNTSKPSPLIDSIIRVDHAGELGADRIYAGQMAVLGNTKMGPLIQHMWDQEKLHKSTFETLIVKHRVRPTALVPVWNVAGFLLGAGTALMGEKAAMACTVAVESVIVDHYNDQLRELMAEPEKNKELMQTIQKFRDEEQEHHDCGIDHGAEQAPFYRALSEVIKFGCKTAITLSKGLFSERNQCYVVTSRSYCTSSETNKATSKWDLYSGVCLERKPVILKPLNELEKKVLKTLSEIEFELSCKSDHELKAENLAKRVADLPKLKGFKPILEQSAHEFEELCDKELHAFKPAPLITLDDKKSDVKSLKRDLSNHLLFLVKEKLGDEEMWLLPHGIRKDSETMRTTAERVLREKCGDQLNVAFLGNAPCGFYKWVYPRSLETGSVGAKVFFFKALYLSGNVQLQKNQVIDYQWAGRKDLKKLLTNKAYLNKISRFLINDEVVDNSDDKEEICDTVLKRAEQKA